MSAPKCPKCGTTLVGSREEYEWWCPNTGTMRDHLGLTVPTCHYYKFMSRTALNDMKAEAIKWRGNREGFVAHYIFPELAARAWELTHEPLPQ